MKYDFIIFGGTGQQGRICARDLIESGYSVLLAGRDTSKIKNLLKNKKTGFIRVDLKNLEEIVKAIKNSGSAHDVKTELRREVLLPFQSVGEDLDRDDRASRASPRPDQRRENSQSAVRGQNHCLES